MPGEVFYEPKQAFPGVIKGWNKGAAEQQLIVRFTEDGSEYWCVE